MMTATELEQHRERKIKMLGAQFGFSHRPAAPALEGPPVALEPTDLIIPLSDSRHARGMRNYRRAWRRLSLAQPGPEPALPQRPYAHE
jgi:hypothetical protein